MKDYTENNNHLDRRNAGAPNANTDLEWFSQFEDKPGIYEVCDTVALENMKKTMLSELVKKINGID